MCELREPLMYFDLGTCTYKYSNQQSMVHAQQLAANGIREQQQSAMVQAAASGEQQSAMVQAADSEQKQSAMVQAAASVAEQG